MNVLISALSLVMRSSEEPCMFRLGQKPDVAALVAALGDYGSIRMFCEGTDQYLSIGQISMSSVPEIQDEAEVDFEYSVRQEAEQDPHFDITPGSVKLRIGDVLTQAAENLPEKFEIEMDSPIEDSFGRAGQVNFKFEVRIKGKTPQPNGRTRLEYEATIKEITHV